MLSNALTRCLQPTTTAGEADFLHVCFQKNGFNADPHFLARKSVQEIDDPLIGRTLHPGPATRLDGDAPESVVAWPGPAVGAHDDYVRHTLLGLPRSVA